ncbi:MAG: histidine phosphatase family protein [Bifidobacteriaceae bacterium]|jgi:phosphohistidine phosphatase|nr:histidine phosphatase family protein [Bifidobacteriaceae bacterium]
MKHLPTRSLVIMRHARAVAHDVARDFERPLSQEGQQQARSVGHNLAASGFLPDLAVVSSAVQTSQTWQLVTETAGFDCPVIHRDTLYRGYINELLEELRCLPEQVQQLIVVGHEPTVSATAVALAGPGSDPAAQARVYAGLPTAARAHLSYSGLWSGLQTAQCQLHAFVKADH